MSDIKEIKPHDKPEEYNFEDYPVPVTDRNRVSAIFMNWVKERILKIPYILESGKHEDGNSYTNYEKWSDGRLICWGVINRSDIKPTDGLKVGFLSDKFIHPIPFVTTVYANVEPFIYNGLSSFNDYEIHYYKMSPLTCEGSLHIVKTSPSWTNTNRRMGLSWTRIGYWK